MRFELRGISDELQGKHDLLLFHSPAFGTISQPRMGGRERKWEDEYGGGGKKLQGEIKPCDIAREIAWWRFFTPILFAAFCR